MVVVPVRLTVPAAIPKLWNVSPVAEAIVGGLAVSQLLTLYTVPGVYLWLDRVRLWVKGRRRVA